MLYMVIETFRDGAKDAVYQRFRERGRMLPEGLEYLESWVDLEGGRCFQLMRTQRPQLFGIWTREWDDLVRFQVVPVVSAGEAAEALAGGG